MGISLSWRVSWWGRSDLGRHNSKKKKGGLQLHIRSWLSLRLFLMFSALSLTSYY